MFDGHISLMHGWIPAAAQVLAGMAVAAAVGWRARRWRTVSVPLAVLAGVGLAAGTHWSISSEGLAGDPAPRQLWVWLTMTGFAAAIAVLGWRTASWRRRAVSLLAVPLSALCAALMLNLWVGYVPTVQTGWAQLTGGPLPGQTDQDSVDRMLAAGSVPAKGVVVPVDIPATASKFKHRGELVYLPPAYFSGDPPPALPVVMMIGGQFNTPADWIRSAGAVATLDDFAGRHGGNAPVFVFADSGGAFNNDTECVNGTRGNAADHLTRDVVPYMVEHFGVSNDPANWAVVGWSTGGTCALNLTVKYPELFRTFVNIDGDIAPSAGTREQTIERLFGGDASAYDQWDPATIIASSGGLDGLAGWFAVSVPPGSPTIAVPGADLPEPEPGASAETPLAAARALCGLGSRHGIDCSVVPENGKHDWPFAARVLARALPWLAWQIDTPEVPETRLPGTGGTPDGVSIAAEAAPTPSSAPASPRVR